jgi:predicted glutamine amidotransferase
MCELLALSTSQPALAVEHGNSAALFIASVPLTDEAWRPFHEGELMAARDGEVLATRFVMV